MEKWSGLPEHVITPPVATLQSITVGDVCIAVTLGSVHVNDQLIIDCCFAVIVTRAVYTPGQSGFKLSMVTLGVM